MRLLLNHLGDGKPHESRPFNLDVLLNHLGDGKRMKATLFFLRHLLNHLGDGKQILEQAAKDCGGQFTYKQEITGAGGGPIETINQNVSTESYLKARERVLDEY